VGREGARGCGVVGGVLNAVVVRVCVRALSVEPECGARQMCTSYAFSPMNACNSRICVHSSSVTCVCMPYSSARTNSILHCVDVTV